jgi:hypothetical protein
MQEWSGRKRSACGTDLNRCTYRSYSRVDGSLVRHLGAIVEIPTLPVLSSAQDFTLGAVAAHFVGTFGTYCNPRSRS